MRRHHLDANQTLITQYDFNGFCPMNKEIYHSLTVYDGVTEELLDVVVIENFSLESFIDQFDVSRQSDPSMLDRYAVGPDDVRFVIEALGCTFDFDFTRFGYFIEAAAG